MIVLVIILIQVLYLKFVIKENPINFFGYSFLIVTTGSMEPEINSGELIIIKKKDKYEIKDIVTYIDKDGFLVTHRIIEIDDFNMITKGDGNDLKDEETPIDCIKGKVVFHSKLLGYFFIHLLKPIIFIYIVIILLINIVMIFNTKEEKAEV